jgi:hypothetical protein
MRAAGCGVEELVWHYIWMVSGRCWGAGLHVGVSTQSTFLCPADRILLQPASSKRDG